MHPTEGLPATPGDPRHVLVRAIEALRADGYHPVMAVELEFYLLDQQRDADGPPAAGRAADGGAHGRPRSTACASWNRSSRSCDDLYAACKVQGLPVRTAISEYAPGQVELTLEHRFDALQAMDEGGALQAPGQGRGQ